MSAYQITIRFESDYVMQVIHEYPSSDLELAFQHFEKQVREEFVNNEIETITIESIPKNDIDQENDIAFRACV